MDKKFDKKLKKEFYIFLKKLYNIKVDKTNNIESIINTLNIKKNSNNLQFFKLKYIISEVFKECNLNNIEKLLLKFKDIGNNSLKIFIINLFISGLSSSICKREILQGVLNSKELKKYDYPKIEYNIFGKKESITGEEKIINRNESSSSEKILSNIPLDMIGEITVKEIKN